MKKNYTEYPQFVMSDNRNFVTATDEDFCVKLRDSVGEDRYFEDTENNQENLNTIAFEGHFFAGRKIKSLKIHREFGLLSDQLAIDTLSVEVESESKPLLTRYTPITVHREGEVKGVFFNGQVKEIGNKHYSIHAESDIALLDYGFHHGGMYLGVDTGTIIAEIMGEISYTIHPDVATLKLYGYLPYTSKRQNIQQVLIATGAAISRNPDGTIHFTVLTDDVKGIFTDDRVFGDGNLVEDTQVTAVQVTEHAYIPTVEEIELFSDSFTDVQTIKFSEPAHSLVCTGGTILETSANHATIQGTGAILLIGKKYRHTTKIVTKGTVTGTPEDKIITVTDATLVTAINSSRVARRIYAYTSCNRIIRQDVLVDTEIAGDIVQVVHPYKSDLHTAAIRSLDFNMSNTLRASAEFLLDYVPQGISEGYKNRTVLTESGEWKVPEGVTEARVVVIGGGTGGNAGQQGQQGQWGKEYATTVVPDDLSHSDGGPGGQGGGPGVGGKVFESTLVLTPGNSVIYSCGFGGAGGLQNGALGNPGEETTFGDISSDLGVADEYIDAMTAETFCVTGINGISGARGAKRMYMSGEDVTGPDGIVWRGGKAGTWAYYNSGGVFCDGEGGGSGGGAVGNSGGNGENGRATYNNGSGFADGGRGGFGGNGSKGLDGVKFGDGGSGGHGGGGGGGGGDALNKSGSSYMWAGQGGPGGNGGSGGNGAPGCIIIYY